MSKVGFCYDKQFGDCIVKFYINPESIQIYMKKEGAIGPRIGSCECSKLKDNIWYFNRLYVHSDFRGNHYGSILLDELLKIIKEEGYILNLDINAYPEPSALSYEDLEAFYVRHGFVKTLQKGVIDYETYYYNAFI